MHTKRENQRFDLSSFVLFGDVFLKRNPIWFYKAPPPLRVYLSSRAAHAIDAGAYGMQALGLHHNHTYASDTIATISEIIHI